MGLYQKRTYRHFCQCPSLVSFKARVKETDLWILADKDLTDQAVQSILSIRRGLEVYLKQNPIVAESLTPLPMDPLAPNLVKDMLRAAQKAQTGPMAAVAGAIAQKVAQELLKISDQIVVENGGDIFCHTKEDLVVGLWAGKSPLSGKLGIKIAALQQPLSLCTSSGTVGHSLSLGKTDAATILADNASLADACATALGNMITHRKDIKNALEWALGIKGIKGALVIMGENLAAKGEIELTSL